MILLSLLSLLSAPAQAGDHELSAELGTLGAADAAWDTFDQRDRLGSFGVRGSYAFHPRLSATASFHRRARGAAHDFSSAEIGASDIPGGSEGYVAAYTGNMYSLGLKADVEPSHYLRPYLSAEGLLLQGTARLDDDTEEDDNVNQILASGLAPGFAVAGGAEIYLGLPEWPVWPALHLEMGYGRALPMDIEPLGDVQFKGFFLRSGVGIRF
ncbi:MAG: outer membrane beta-barrel protein [Alphaproteobacteria bacterium]|nr:outer membrane beta-barrel protein [Alphaproteobacteria bacterium]MCB9791579.1 outer membrane beta-barrel protein [Alphaproteobacteria bacterium]